MCYQRVRARVCRARKWLVWLMPTRKQRWALGILIFVTLAVTGRAERVRRDELLRVTTAQLQEQIDRADETHEQLQAQINELTARLARLEQTH